MTQDEFLNKYHDYRALSYKEAIDEARRINEEGIDNDTVVAVDLGNLGLCLMLESAYNYIIKKGME